MRSSAARSSRPRPTTRSRRSYSAEASAALAGDPEALYLVSYPVDGATIARAWISAGGPAKFLLNDGMNSTDFIARGRGEVSRRRLRHLLGHQRDRLDRVLLRELRGLLRRHQAGRAGGRPLLRRRRHRRAGHRQGGRRRRRRRSRRRSRRWWRPDGEPIHAGKEEFAKALALIAEGKPIRYEGVIGPVSFDQFGDITGPFRLWRIQNGEVTTVGEMSADEVAAIKGGS